MDSVLLAFSDASLTPAWGSQPRYNYENHGEMHPHSLGLDNTGQYPDILASAGELHVSQPWYSQRISPQFSSLEYHGREDGLQRWKDDPVGTYHGGFRIARDEIGVYPLPSSHPPVSFSHRPCSADGSSPGSSEAPRSPRPQGVVPYGAGSPLYHEYAADPVDPAGFHGQVVSGMHLGGHGYSGVAPSLTQMLPDPTMGPEKNQHHDGGSLASTVAVFAANTSQPVEQYSTGVQVTSQTDGRETPPMSKNLTDHGCQFRSPVSPVKKKVPASPPSSHRSQPTKSRPKQQQQQQQHRGGKRPRRRIYNSSITVAAQPAIKTKAVAITPNSSPSSSSSFSPLSSPSSKSKAPRIFVCSFAHYGCDKVFPFKNEWKRHIATKHLQLGFYRCDVEGCNIDEQLQQAKKNNKKKKSPVHTRSTSSSSSSSSSSSISEKKPALRYNDFNRKDLFTQHQRRMHSPWAGRADRASPSQEEQKTFDQGLDVVHHRCWRERRQPPTRSRCGFCGEEFEGPMSWDKRMEHVGKHYERGDYDREKVEMEDEFLRDWGVDTGVIQVVQPGREWRLTSLIEKERG